jgi:uncharacterized protein with NAD-binding domain and iron-sulfur cluster
VTTWLARVVRSRTVATATSAISDMIVSSSSGGATNQAVMKIAVIGTGIAGLGAGYALSHAHEVELFEANGYAGGHANTVTVDAHEIDTGFIVHNEANYPGLTRLFRELGVATLPSEMSFSMTCGCGLQWSSAGPGGARCCGSSASCAQKPPTQRTRRSTASFATKSTLTRSAGTTWCR